MGSKINPTAIGVFVVGAVIFVIAGVLLFGGGKFFKEKITFVLYFDDSVQGLNVGAPLIFRGVQVGQVTNVIAQYEPKTDTILIKVLVEFVHGSIDVEGSPFTDPRQRVEALIQRGLRASLKMQSFVTGLMYVNLDFHPGTPIKRLGLDPRYPELPTVPSETEQMLASVQQTLAEISKLPLEELLTEIQGTFKRVNALLDVPGLKKALESLDDLVVAAHQLLHNADGQIGPLGAKLAAAADSARTALEAGRVAMTDAQKLLRDTDGQVAPLASSAKDTLAAARGTLGQAQKSLVTLTDAATPALKQGEKAMASVASLTGHDSVTLNDLSHTLKALEEAAKAIRILADSLEHHPEALLRGKGK
jgi:phospholipid/cholesterol/gamma-HCH transport system substrate-binding protein